LSAPSDRVQTVPASRAQRATYGALLLLAMLAIVRVATGADQLTSAGTFGAALTLTMPILLAGLGGLYAERTGVVNIGLEGMMILGTWFGAWAGWKYGPWAGVAAGALGGGAGGLVHAVATVTFGIDQIISGVAINILAAGLTRFLSVVAFTVGTGGSAAQSPQVKGTIGNVSLPILSGGKIFGWSSPDLLGWVGKRHVFLISDAAAILKGVTADVAILTVIALAIVPLTYWLLWRTTLGLRLRSVGEHPAAAESLGVPVYTMKYIGVVISGCLAGFGGAFLVLQSAGIYREGQTAGRGFIGLAALIFGNWRPGGVLAGAGLFGYADGLQLRSDEAVHGLLLFLAVALGLLAVWMLFRRRTRWGTGLGVLAIGVLGWYLSTNDLPGQLVNTTPQIVTLLVLSLASQRLRPPAADGRPYRRGQLV
jgi:ABC-type uncharacterized transport system permease subunit